MLPRLRSKALFAAAVAALVLTLSSARSARAQAGQFDLTGPTLEVKVMRKGRTLPIAEVPTLAEGDRLWLHPSLADNESVKYLMVAVFLRGSTNPPPEDWFYRVETWNKKVIDEGIYINVPLGAQQALVLLAPQTGGDFSTIRNAVQGRPGSFVRASQDLNEASLDRARMDTYLAALRNVNDPAKVKDISAMLARSLSLKLDQQCFDRASDQQAPCLMQNQDQLILDNGRSTTLAASLTNGPASDLALQAGSAPNANYGYYNSYISTVLDIVRILDNLHTAQYQYIPALASESDIAMKTRLNTPPSFHNPKSVVVIALPPIEPPHSPPLRPVDPKQTLCMDRHPLVLPVEGAPSVFSTQYAHGLTLHLKGAHDKTVDLPAKADPGQGGFLVPTDALSAAGLGTEVSATIQGYWGFEPYTGPTFRLESTTGTHWTVADADKNALVVGRDDELHLLSPAAACVDTVELRAGNGKSTHLDWKLTEANQVTVKVPLKDAQPGSVTVAVTEAGSHDVETLELSSFSEAGKLDSFTIHAGDREGALQGTRLDEVAKLTVGEAEFAPGALERTGSTDELKLALPQGAAAPKLEAGAKLTAHVTLKDGRHLDVPAAVSGARPAVALLNKSEDLPAPPPAPAGASPAPPHIHLADADEVPLEGKLTFALKSESPAAFARGESIEVETADGLATVTLSLAGGGLVLQDAKTAIATLDPGKSFGSSGFGPLQFRPVMADGTVGDWQKLGTLVRLPQLASLSCPSDPNSPCELQGSSLFLLGSVAADKDFTRSVTVPDGFAANTLDVPHAAGDMYVKLRDDPAVVNTLSSDAGAQAHVGRAARGAAATGRRPSASESPAAPAAGPPTAQSAAAPTH